MWIRPLQAEYANGKLVLLAPNRFVLDWIAERFSNARINELVKQFSDKEPPPILLEIGSKRAERTKPNGSQTSISNSKIIIKLSIPKRLLFLYRSIELIKAI